MLLTRALAALGLPVNDPAAERWRRRLAEELPDAPADWCALAAALVRSLAPDAATRSSAPWPRWNDVPPPFVLGIAGAQGSGKSTLARVLEHALRLAGANAAACSIDDFYLTRAERRRLAETVHPRLATRGVPGTHDVALLERTLRALGRRGETRLPSFDKGTDERRPRSAWRAVTGPLDVLVLEGWCVGAAPEPPAALAEPVNDLEAREDPDGRWREHVNGFLAGPYARLWRRLHGLVYLEVPGFAAVRRWRTEQEQALPAERRMDGAALERFIAHYERLTRWMLTQMPSRAPLVVRLDDAHRAVELRRNSQF
ncbi:MAG TPA: hypothetical protein VF210_04380 [Pseudomonadales bacterium]